MKDYIKAKKDIEKINKKNNNEKRKQVFYSIWFIGYLITGISSRKPHP